MLVFWFLREFYVLLHTNVEHSLGKHHDLQLCPRSVILQLSPVNFLEQLCSDISCRT